MTKSNRKNDVPLTLINAGDSIATVRDISTKIDKKICDAIAKGKFEKLPSLYNERNKILS